MSKAVQFAVDGVPGLPSKEPQAGALCGRKVCQYWRMSAGIVCLAASILAIACSIIWNANGLCVLFGASTIGSSYTIYLGYEFHHLQSLEQSVVRLETTEGELRTSLETSEANNQALQSRLSEVESMRDRLQREATEHVAQLQNLHKLLSELQITVSKDHGTFADQLEIFKQYVGELGTLNPPQLAEAAQSIRDTFEVIKEWKDEAANAKRLGELNSILGSMREAQGALDEAREKERKTQAQLAAVQAEVTQLTMVRGDIEGAVQTLLQHLEELKLEKGELSKVRVSLETVLETIGKNEPED